MAEIADEAPDWHADEPGMAGSIVAALYCLGTRAVVALLGALAAGFLVNDIILLPLLAVSLGLSLWVLGKGREIHGRAGSPRLGTTDAFGFIAGILAGRCLMAAGMLLQVSATSWNELARRACKSPEVPAALRWPGRPATTELLADWDSTIRAFEPPGS